MNTADKLKARDYGDLELCQDARPLVSSFTSFSSHKAVNGERT